MRYVFILLMLMSCTRDVSFDPTITISKEIIKFLYNESNKEEPVVEWSGINDSYTRRVQGPWLRMKGIMN